MAAAAQNFNLIFSNAPYGGKIVQTESASNTDVANAYATFYSNGGLTFAVVKQDCYLTDIILDVDVTDTSQMQVFIDGRDINMRVLCASVVAAVNNRLSSPLGIIKKGAMIQIKELT